MKKLTPKVEPLTEKELEAIAERDEELQLFEKFEMPLFLRDMYLHGDLEPEETLEALHALFFYGFDLDSWGRGRTPVENAYTLYKRDNPETAAYILKKVMESLKDAIPF